MCVVKCYLVAQCKMQTESYTEPKTIHFVCAPSICTSILEIIVQYFCFGQSTN